MVFGSRWDKPSGHLLERGNEQEQSSNMRKMDKMGNMDNLVGVL